MPTPPPVQKRRKTRKNKNKRVHADAPIVLAVPDGKGGFIPVSTGGLIRKRCIEFITELLLGF